MSTAALVSPALGPPGLACTFSFWYYCKDHYPSLKATARTAGEVIEELVVDYYDCSSNQEWRQGNLFIGEQGTRITVSIVLSKVMVWEEFGDLGGRTGEGERERGVSWLRGGKGCRKKESCQIVENTNQ